MTQRSPAPGYAAVLIDVVASRARLDRAALQAEVGAALEAVNGRRPALDPLTQTVGDEIQGTYGGLLDAVRAVAELRLELLGRVALRAGIGWGDIVMHDPDRAPFGQDGSAWWAARAALDTVARSGPRSGYAARVGLEMATPQTAVGAAPPSRARAPGGPLPPPRPPDVALEVVLRSHLALLDRALATVDETEARIVLADLQGHNTDTIAGALGITASAVSQRRSRNHLRELVVALRLIDTSA